MLRIYNVIHRIIAYTILCVLIIPFCTVLDFAIVFFKGLVAMLFVPVWLLSKLIFKTSMSNKNSEELRFIINRKTKRIREL